MILNLFCRRLSLQEEILTFWKPCQQSLQKPSEHAVSIAALGCIASDRLPPGAGEGLVEDEGPGQAACDLHPGQGLLLDPRGPWQDIGTTVVPGNFPFFPASKSQGVHILFLQGSTPPWKNGNSPCLQGWWPFWCQMDGRKNESLLNEPSTPSNLPLKVSLKIPNLYFLKNTARMLFFLQVYKHSLQDISFSLQDFSCN